jgi:hypothetical protein
MTTDSYFLERHSADYRGERLADAERRRLARPAPAPRSTSARPTRRLHRWVWRRPATGLRTPALEQR